ncbi:hypothetical protein [Sphingomonas faeni]|uniref:hypothetical protein n=1 Tax=Sphingomonas faeni TaxID=185950 RepID=UPI002783C452|nr:hypothetical protein [Sphingomonas faeni]MDQ0837990.1 NTP pyrophosphatase (non-canonical NTP hydrolase) [Sphingomonas faeni]
MRANSKGAAPSIAAFQTKVCGWMDAVFGEDGATDPKERALRFLEEAIELAQAIGVKRQDVERVCDYVCSRPAGEPVQEVGGVMITLAALCQKSDIDLQHAALSEFERVDTALLRNHIRSNQLNKRAAGLVAS